MKEEFISSLWRNCLLRPEDLKTTDGEEVVIMHPGYANTNSGPDFFAAKLRINGTIWAGNVEVHVLASDWTRHGHHLDGAYDNIILHLVYSCDKIIYNSKGNTVPTLEVKNHYEPKLYDNYQKLRSAATWIACEPAIGHVDGLIIDNWLNRLLIERLERKTRDILQFFNYFSKHWEDTCYYLIARNFGFKVNATAFGLLAQKTPRAILMKNRDRVEVLEALLFGQAGMLEEPLTDSYGASLKREYRYQQRKHHLTPITKDLWKFARMRPKNFPTIRIAQFAMLLHRSGHIFRKLIESQSIEDLYALFGVTASPYWDTHYRFDHASSYSVKRMGRDAWHNILINTVAPLVFIYGKETIQDKLSEKALAILQDLAPENNKIIRKWKELGCSPKHAADTQALLELKKYYCIPKRCLHCSIGYKIIFQ